MIKSICLNRKCRILTVVHLGTHKGVARLSANTLLGLLFKKDPFITTLKDG